VEGLAGRLGISVRLDDDFIEHIDAIAAA
jgi:hypothetical protein